MTEKDWPPKEEFADRLARLRRHKGLGNKAIALATGVKPKTVSMWAGGQEPKGAALLALARLLDVSPEYLLEGQGTTGKEIGEGRSGLPSEEKQKNPLRTTQRKRKRHE